MTITFSGDIAVTSPIPNFSVSDIVRSFFGRADYRFCCFEAPFIGTESINTCSKAGPSLCQHADITKVDVLFTHATIANNHIMDYGTDGCRYTMQYLASRGIEFAGAGFSFDEIYAPIILEKNGVTVAVLCLAEAQFGCCRYQEEPRAGYAWIFNGKVCQCIQRLKREHDYVVCFAHAGLEMFDYPLPEWRSCYHSLIDYGCDLIVASHPHVIQGKEEYKGRWIYYSLGNFFFNNNLTEERWTNSLSLSVTFEEGKVSVKELFTQFSNHEITLADEKVGNRFVELSACLINKDDTEYTNGVNDEAIRCWNDFYESYFSYPIILHGDNSIKSKLIQKIFFRYFYKYIKLPVGGVLLYHNIVVDTHRFVISRALSLINKIY